MENYELLLLPNSNLAKFIKCSFKELPADKFLNKEEPFQYRYRRYGTANILNSIISWNSSEHFMQKTDLNKYAGGISRSFEPLENNMKEFIGNNIIKQILQKLPKSDYSVGVHQIRITANDKYMGKPAPEGIHQDGFDYVAVTCVDMSNVAGGTSLLVDPILHYKTYLETELKPGQILLFNDKTYAHYASPIVPKAPGECYRDVIVTTYKKFDEEKNHA